MGAGEFQDGAVLHLWVCGAWEGGGVRGAGVWEVVEWKRGEVRGGGVPRGRSGGVAGRALGASVGYEVRCGLVGHDHGWVQRLSAVGIDRSIDRGRAPASPSCRCCAALRCVAGDGARDVALWTMGDGKQSTMYCTSNVGVGEVMNDPFEPMNIHIVFELAEATFSYPTTAISISDYTIAFAFAFAFDGSFPRFCEGTHALHQCQQVGVPKRPPLPRGNPHRDLLDPRRRSVGVRLAFGWRSVGVRLWPTRIVESAIGMREVE